LKTSKIKKRLAAASRLVLDNIETIEELKAHPVVLPAIDGVNIVYPRTVIFWADGSATVVKCTEGETWDTEKAIMAAMAKRAYGNRGYNDTVRRAISMATGRKVRR